MLHYLFYYKVLWQSLPPVLLTESEGEKMNISIMMRPTVWEDIFNQKEKEIVENSNKNPRLALELMQNLKMSGP